MCKLCDFTVILYNIPLNTIPIYNKMLGSAQWRPGKVVRGNRQSLHSRSFRVDARGVSATLTDKTQ